MNVFSRSSESRTTSNEPPLPPNVVKTDSPIRAVAFTADGRHLVSGDKETVRVWKAGSATGGNHWHQTVSIKAKDVRCVAISKEGIWVAAGTSWGEMTVWERKSGPGLADALEEIIMHNDSGHTVTCVDFSPDSRRLVSASGSRTAIVWDIAERRIVAGPLKHTYWVVAAKFSPKGDRIATATYHRESVRIYDSNGAGLYEIQAKVTAYYNTGLLWSRDSESIFVLSDNTIKQFNPSTSHKSPISERAIFDSNYPSIASPHPGKFIIHSASCGVTLYKKLVSIKPPVESSTGEPEGDILTDPYQDIQSIAVSQDGRLLATGEGDGTITFMDLPHGIIAQGRR